MTGRIAFSVLHQHSFYIATAVVPDDQMTFHGLSREETVMSGARIDNTRVPNSDTITRGIEAEFVALAEEISRAKGGTFDAGSSHLGSDMSLAFREHVDIGCSGSCRFCPAVGKTPTPAA